jgi:DNA-directed RNA polymerase beta subunit
MPPALAPNELSAKWLGACGLNPFHIYDSSSRLQMLSQHLGQMLVVKGSTPRQLQTGMERQFGKFTYKVAMPCDGKILAIIPRYLDNAMGFQSIAHNPQTVVIYENDENKEIGIINLTDYCSNHQYFGFRYKRRPGFDQLRVGAYIKAGTIFLDSPSITDEGDYAFGVDPNVIFMSHPAVAEDGIAVSDAFLKRVGYRTFETRTVEYGKKRFALNTYGDDNRYKPFPDIGEIIRPDGVLMALRDYEPEELAVVEQSVKACQQVDFTFDTVVYPNGAGGRVIDIRINHDIADANCAAVHMDSQPQKYDNARRVFYAEILKQYNSLKYKSQDTLQITPEFHQLVVQAQSVMTEGGKQRVTKLYRKAPVDTYRIEFVIEYEFYPNMGGKLTDLHGGKGVICQIIPEDQMPIDSDGNRADIIMDGNATINRANPGRMYEQYYNASARDTHKRLCAVMGVKPFEKEVAAYNQIIKLPAEQLSSVWDALYNFYRIISPRMCAWFDEGKIAATQPEYLAEIVHKGIGLYIPTDNPPSAQDVVRQIENTPLYKPTYGPVTYVGNSGRQVTTVKPARIGPVYVILLEKTGDDWSAVSSGKLQLFGVLSQLTKNDKFSRPVRMQAVRVAGEGEIRILLANCGAFFSAEIIDRNNNPIAHQAMVSGILSADHPGNIHCLVDRAQIPYGGSKALQLFKHMCEVSGFRMEFMPHDVNAPKISV